MEAQHHRARILGVEAFAHNLCPHPPGRAELGHLFKQVIVTVKEKGELTRKCIDVQTSIYGSLDIANGIGKGESHLLHSRRPSFTNVIAANADSVPARQMLGTLAERVWNDAHRVLGRIDKCAPRN